MSPSAKPPRLVSTNRMQSTRSDRGTLAAGRFEEATLYARALDREDRFGYDVVLLRTSAKRPRAISGREYLAGELLGRAFVYDFASHEVVCAGDVTARSSREIGYVFSDQADTPASLGAAARMGEAIEADLRLQSERSLIEALRWRSGSRMPITD